MNKKGFTLIEILGIIALLGVIIVVAMPALIESNKKANENKVQDACDVISAACDSYRVLNPTATSVDVTTLKNNEFLKDDFEIPTGLSLNANSPIPITNTGCTMPSVCNN